MPAPGRSKKRIWCFFFSSYCLSFFSPIFLTHSHFSLLFFFYYPRYLLTIFRTSPFHQANNVNKETARLRRLFRPDLYASSRKRLLVRLWPALCRIRRRVSYSEKLFRCFVCFCFTFPSFPSKYLPSPRPWAPARFRYAAFRFPGSEPCVPLEGKARGCARALAHGPNRNPPLSTFPGHTAQTRKPPAAPRGTETHQTSQETRKDEHAAH